MAKLIIVLTSICVVASLLLAVTYSYTKDKIKEQEEKVEKDALKNVLPEAFDFTKKEGFYVGVDKDGNTAGYVLVGEGKGYSSIIKIMIGLDASRKMKGIKILSQQETPGLGDRVNEVKASGTLWDKLEGKKFESSEPWFQAQFRDKGPDEIQAITGATITSKAVVNIVKEAVEKFNLVCPQ